MELVADGQVLKSMLVKMGRLVPAVSVLPFATHLRLEATDGHLSVSHTDVEICVTMKMEAEVKDEGLSLVPGRFIADVFRSIVVGKGTDLHLESVNGGGLSIKVNRQSMTVTGMDGSEFPEAPAVDGVTFAIPWDVWVKIVGVVVPIASKDKARPILAGVRCEIMKGQATFFATDGFRLVRLEVGAIEVEEDVAFTVAAKCLVDFHRLVNPAEHVMMRLSKDHKRLKVGVPDVMFTMSLLAGEYPNVDSMMSQETTTWVTSDRKELMRAVKVAAIGAGSAELWFVIEEGSKPKKDRILIEAGAKGSEVKTHADLDVAIRGPGLKLGVNLAFLLDALISIDTEQVILEFAGASKPILVKPDNDEGLLHLIMPLFLGSDRK